MRRTAALLSMILLPVALGGCAGGPHSARNALPAGADARTAALAGMKDGFDGATNLTAAPVTDAAPLIRGLGFAQVSGQPGKTGNEKRLMAIRAARMEALRDLTEQVHGIHLTAETTVGNAIIGNDHMQGLVEGTIRGARTLRVTPKDNDSYEVEMALDRDTVAYILRALGAKE